MEPKENVAVLNEKSDCDIQNLQLLEKAIFSLDAMNLESSIQSILKIFDANFPYSFEFIICRLVYFAFRAQTKDFDVYFQFLLKFDLALQAKHFGLKIMDIFTNFLLNMYSCESNYLLGKMIEQNLIDPKNFTDNTHSLYFAQFKTEKNIEEYKTFQNNLQIKLFFDDIEDLKANNWELHRKLFHDGINSSEIAKAIRYDNLAGLQEISAQSDFDFDLCVGTSLYERCSFVNQENVTLIDYAAYFGAIKCFKYLLMNGANVNKTGKYAIAGGNIEIIHLCEQNHSTFENAYEAAIQFHRNNVFLYLYENKIKEINNLEELGKKCVEFFEYEIFSFLLKEGMKINDDIINEAAKGGNLFLVRNFIENNQIPKNILAYASSSNNVELVDFITKQNGFDINAKDDGDWTALMYASFNGHTEIVKLLLEQEGIDINAKDDFGDTALIDASYNGNTEIVELLLEQEGIDVNAQDEEGNTALIKVIENNHLDIVKLLLEQEGIDVNIKNDKGEASLLIGCEKGYTNIVQALLVKSNIELNFTNSNGETALTISCINHNYDIIKMLLQKEGIDINKKNKKGETALTIACSDNSYDIVKSLLGYLNIDVNVKNDHDKTPLMISSQKGFIDIVEYLLKDENIDINIQNNYGWTALMLASHHNHINIVKLLLEQKGIDIDLQTKSGKTAIMLASSRGYQEIYNLLDEHEKNRLPNEKF